MQLAAEIRALLKREPRLELAACRRLWGALLDGALDDVEVGAIVAALAVSTETADEVAGLHAAARSRLARVDVPADAAVVAIPAYGLFPGESSIVALCAMLLRRFDLRVVVHGALDVPCGVSCARILCLLGVMPSVSIAQALEHLADRSVAFVPVHLLSPPLARLLSLRSRLGMETTAHTVAPLLDPTHAGATRLVLGVGDARAAMRDALIAHTEGDALALSWNGGDAGSNVMLRPRIERCRGGARELLFEADGPDMRAAAWPAPGDALAIAATVDAITNGRAPVPIPVLNLAAACLYAAGRAPDLARAKAAAAIAGDRLAA